MNESDANGFKWMLIVIFCATVAFCGEPDLHDLAIERVQIENRKAE